MRRKLIAANWKMNGSQASGEDLVAAIDASAPDGIEIAIFPSFVYLPALIARFQKSHLDFGGQDVSQHVQGAYTGEVGAKMLHDIGTKYVLVGHSERRQYHAETDAIVANKFLRAQAVGLVPILCVGESLSQRDDGSTEAVIATQIDAVVAAAGIGALHNCVVAYEPVWAIGSGRTASPAHAQAVHAFIRGKIAGADATIADSLRILYGGSMKPENAAELLAQPDVDGGLIGGASLVASDFLAICAAARK